jgi:Arc/MetJ-type ribon-helix-helix transcriptional regulator
MAKQEIKLKTAESEKITINLGPIDLGQIDLLVQEGFYSNRTDLIRTAIRNQLNQHAEVVKQTVARKAWYWACSITRADLEAIQAAGQRLQIQVLGLASIASDVSVELALATIESILYSVRCMPALSSRRHWRRASIKECHEAQFSDPYA